ncbi:uncharacterized protein [Haliotis cracherodii]|uniref:uncharacterized protein n=1 Tax=Haliotis cracherodii TaxID=6455 RepID=UPI0039ED4ED6
MALQLFNKRIVCHRKKQTLAVLAAVVLVFCLMQLFSLLKLNIFRQQQGESVLYGSKHNDGRSTGIHYPDNDRELFTKSKETGNHRNVIQDDLPRGVHVDDAHLFKPNDRYMFTCIKTKSEIPWEHVNDDYCDCEDSSDEPGTSACPASRFYCTYQIPHEDVQFVPGSRVNDGICDCCDGSDEWSGHQVPKHMHLTEESQEKHVYQSPCGNHCEKIVHLRGKEEQIKHEGQRQRRKYVDLAKSLPASQRQEYGPEGVFYQLAQQCFEHHTTEYEYTICPFSSVTQQKFPHPRISLGKQPRWEKQKPGDYVLVMAEGDANLCPLNHARKTKIHFFCGVQDHIVKMVEKERCSYSVTFSTPAACS